MKWSCSTVAPWLASTALVLVSCMPRPIVPPTPSAHPRPGGANAATPTGDNTRTYSSIITKDAKTRTGMFITHRVGDRLYFEIPSKELNVDMLIVGRYTRAAAGDFWAYGGDEFTERTVRWERVSNRILLRSTSFTDMADTTLPVYRAVQAGNYSPILASFEILTFGADSAAVVDVTRLFTASIPELAAIRGQVDPARSYIENVVAFPSNVEIEATQTGTPGAPNPQPGGFSPVGVRSVLAHWSMIHLPDVPMKPRHWDERVGYFNIARTDYGTKEFRSVDQQYITRWRLEKKDPSAPLSEPVKPIVYYIDPATPTQWRPWIRKAVLDWVPAFEAAGFKNAIRVADPPANDSDWSAEDIRHTVIRWLPSPNENAVGPHVSDPRTGEILNGSLRIFHNVLNLQRDWYFTQAGAVDARAQRWPFPDSLMGRLVEYVVSHEIGHTLGLRHDHLGSSLYPADSMRSRTWIHRMGHSPSIMDYSRYNYVAQPEDSIAIEDLIPRVGPYDEFAIHWGYAPVQTTNPRNVTEEERPTLDRWALVQDTVPWLRFAEYSPTEFGTMAEAVGDADPVWSTGWGVKNLERVMRLLPTVAIHPGEDNDDLQELYQRVVTQWQTEMEHVVTVVGGAKMQLKSGTQPGPVYTPLSRARQQAAVQFLNTRAFTTPTFLIDETLARRFEANGTLWRIGGAQERVLSELLDDGRLIRMMENSALDSNPANRYTVAELLRDLRGGLWSELSAKRVSIDLFRRALQSNFLSQMDDRLNPRVNGYLVEQYFIYFVKGGRATTDYRAALRDDLTQLRAQVVAAIPRSADTATRTYLQTVKIDIDRILTPK